jgi:hypothetical protein
MRSSIRGPQNHTSTVDRPRPRTYMPDWHSPDESADNQHGTRRSSGITLARCHIWDARRVE